MSVFILANMNLKKNKYFTQKYADLNNDSTSSSEEEKKEQVCISFHLLYNTLVN